MNATHTPGKWRYCIHPEFLPDFIIKHGSRKIAKVNCFAGHPENAVAKDCGEGEANARLIAAAPDGLNAARIALDEIHRLYAGQPEANFEDNGAVKTLKAFIAAATGGKV